MDRKHYLGIDIGSVSVKIVLLSPVGAISGRIHSGHELPLQFKEKTSTG